MAGHLTARLRLGASHPRFAAAFAGLALALGASAVAGAWGLRLFGAGEARDPGVWSVWHPASTGFVAAQQIAFYVGNGNGGNAPAEAAAFRIGTSPSAAKATVSALVIHPRGGGLHIVSRGLMGYALCGSGKSCTLAWDSLRDRRLARREALELALYSFSYLDGVDTVAVLLPPRPGEQPVQGALLYRRADLASSLGRPLSATLPPGIPHVRDLDGAIGQRIDGMTLSHFYRVDRGAVGGSRVTLLLSPAESA
jgi:hypothetical protein